MARALYDSGPSDTHLVAFGLSRADIPESRVEVWRCNWSSFLIFEAMSTQWRHGYTGPIGLDYGVLKNVMRLLDIPTVEFSSRFADIREMEWAVLGEQTSQLI